MPEDTPDHARRFTVLEHRWNGVHWDLLVEDGDALRTWAVDAPIVAGVELPARALPAHRRLYLDYEGPIAGDRGEVVRWDAGLAWVEVWDATRVRLRLAGRQLVGVVELWTDAGEGATPTDLRRWVVRFGKLS